MKTLFIPTRSAMDRPLRIYFLLAFGITWGAGGLALLAGKIRPGGGALHLHPLHYVAAFGPSIAGVVMAASTDGWAGVRRLLARVVPSRSALPWYVAVLIGFPALNLVAARLLDPGFLARLPAWPLAPDFLARLPPWLRLFALLPFTLVNDTGPLGEEFGWRGFALPRLLQRRRPLAAALILGVIWWAWHLPTFFIPALSQHQLSIPIFLVNSLALSVIMTWLHQQTRGDLLLMILVHVAANYCGGIGVPFKAEVGTEVACAALILARGGLR